MAAVPVAAADAITSTDVEGPYVAGVEQEFSITTTSDSGYTSVLFKFVVADTVLADIASFEYYGLEGTPPVAGWYTMPLTQEGSNLEGYFGPSGGFPMSASYDETTEFRVNFNTVKTYPVTVSLVNMSNGNGEAVITTATFSAVVKADYTAAVLAAADHLAANQNPDGGFSWDLPAGDSTTNTLGITAMGILKAYELEDKATYETALAKAYKFAVDTPPTYSGEVETALGVDSFPDVTFMVWLARHAHHDTTLLGAIQTEVPGTTAASIAALAKERWDGRVAGLGNGSATAMAEYIRDARIAIPDCIPWDLEAAVKAALSLDAYYPGEGYDTQAISIATVIYNAVDDPEGNYFNSGDTTQEGYILGLTGAIEAFQEVGLYGDKVGALKTLLINVQNDAGYWNWHGATPVDMSVQNTAYAVMALLSQGESDAVAAAQKGADWLVSAQNAAALDGGWHAEGGTGDECLEIDSEAAWAIKALLDRFSGSVGMYAHYTPFIGISVEPTWVDFGDVVPGEASQTRMVNIHNYGNVNVELSASIINESPPGVYTAGLTIDDTSGAKAAAGWSYSSLEPCNPLDVSLVLTVPSDTPPGTYTATLVFWAEQAGP